MAFSGFCTVEREGGEDNVGSAVFRAEHPEKFASLTSLPPENDTRGNREYKLQLLSKSPLRLKQLVTQMKWRLAEGHGEAIYEIGVEDNGRLAGLSREDLQESIATLREMARQLNAHISMLRERQVGDCFVAEAHIRCVPDDQQFVELRVAVLGNADAGKSTLLGVLTSGVVDNGRGLARLNLFRHKHEIESGRTSCISHELMGFNEHGMAVCAAPAEEVTDETLLVGVVPSDGTATTRPGSSGSGGATFVDSWAEILEESKKVVIFVDLAGHSKFLKTTVSGLTAQAPNVAMLVVDATAGLCGTTREHLALAVALKVPFFVVITKTDACLPSRLRRTQSQLTTVLKSPGCRKTGAVVEDEDDLVTMATSVLSGSVTPIFLVSSVTARGLALLRAFLNVLPVKVMEHNNSIARTATSTPTTSTATAADASTSTIMSDDDSGSRSSSSNSSTSVASPNGDGEFLIDKCYTITNVGQVVVGTVRRGAFAEGDRVFVGPNEHAQFTSVVIRSIQRLRRPYKFVSAGQRASFSLVSPSPATADAPPPPLLRRGMAVLTSTTSTTASLLFVCDLLILSANLSVSPKWCTTVHVGGVCQAASLVSLHDCESLSTGQRATATFRFVRQPEYLPVGMPVVFRDTRTRGIGTIIRSIDMTPVVEHVVL